MDKRLPYDILDRTPQPLYTDDYVPTMLRRKQELYQAARSHLQAEKLKINEQQHKLSRRKTLEIGILVFKKLLTKVALMPKLTPAFIGPFRVVAIKNNKAFIKSLNDGSESWAHFDVLKLASAEYQARNDTLNEQSLFVSPLPE